MNICLYGASSSTLDRVYLDAAYDFGARLAKNGHTLVYGCGAQGVIQASVGDYPGFPRRIELNGESGTIILEEDRIVKWEVAGDSAYHIYEQEPAPEVRSHSEAGAIDPSGHVAQLRNFIDAVRGEGTLLVDEAEGRKALALVLAAYRSAAEGKPVVL